MVKAKSKAEIILSELKYNFGTFSIVGFTQFIGDSMGRTIISIPWKMPATLFGAWMSDGDEPKEYIFYRDNVPAIHQVHIQLHELSHLLLKHPTLQINRDFIRKVVNSHGNLPFDDLLRLRSPEMTQFEIEAETLASLIQERVIRNNRLEQLTSRLSSNENVVAFLKDLGIDQ